MSRYKLKKRKINFWFWLIIAVMTIIPALPCIYVWLQFSPITFWEKLILFFIIAVFLYPGMIIVELFIFAIYD